MKICCANGNTGRKDNPMTASEITTQIRHISNGRVNGERFSRAELLNYINKMTTIGTPLVIEVTLPDGNWFCEITHRNASSDSWDYFLPDTREESDAILERLLDRYNHR